MKRLITMLSISFMMLAAPLLVPASASAACASDTSAKGQVQRGLGETGSDCSSDGVEKTVKAVVEILSIVAGIAAVIMVIVAGFKYTTSGGDSGKVGSAKSTLTYALIGVAIAALAQVMVHYVINTASDSVTPCPGKPALSINDPKCT